MATLTCFDQHPLTLQSGTTLGPITIAYETYGHLNKTKSNAILLCHTLTADANAADETGWWHYYVGPNKSIDTTNYFVICSNVLGSCKGTTGPTSSDFPIITIEDMVTVQKALIDHLNITQLWAVIGGSMGGMQALIWSIKYPQSVQKCIPIATTSQLSTQALAFNTIGRNAILKHGKEGLILARMLGHTTYLSNNWLSKKFGRKLQEKEHYSFSFDTDFQIESYLTYQGQKFMDGFNPFSYIYLSKAISYFDLYKTYQSLDAAFHGVQANYLFISISSDWLYPPSQSQDMVKTLLKLNKPITYATLHSPHGHDAFLLPNKHLAAMMKAFL